MKRLQTRNTSIAYYQLYVSEEEAVDANGYKTGEHIITYGDKTAFRATISYGAVGIFAGNNAKAINTPYGIRDEHSITLYTDKDYGFDSKTVLWVGDTDKANYHVTNCAPSSMGYTISAKEIQ